METVKLELLELKFLGFWKYGGKLSLTFPMSGDLDGLAIIEHNQGHIRASSSISVHYNLILLSWGVGLFDFVKY